MNDSSIIKKVYSVRSLDEAKKILSSVDKMDMKDILVWIYVSVCVCIINLILKLLRFFLFKNRNIDKFNFENIVVYTVGIVGDNVVMLPAVAALRRRYPKAEITIIANGQSDGEGARGIFELSPLKDRLIILDDHPVQWRNLSFVMDNSKFGTVESDLFVNLSPFGNKGWIGAVVREMIFAKKLGAQYAIGFRLYSLARRGKLNRVHHLRVANEPRRPRDVLSELNISPVEDEDLLPRNSSSRSRIIQKLEKKGVMVDNFFVVNPGGKLKYQCWSAVGYGNVAKMLAEKYRTSVIVTGVSSENHIAEEVVLKSDGKAINLAGLTTLQELFELLRLSKGCLTNDTGTMHVAAMIGLPTVAVFSQQQSPIHWLPLGKNVISLFCPISCGYCYDNKCEKLACLDFIKDEDVIAAIDNLMTNEK